MKSNLATQLGILTAILTLFSSGGQSSPERAAAAGNERIVGGVKVNLGYGPWAVRLNIKKREGTFICGASLVSPTVKNDRTVSWLGNRGDDARWLITAAHCLYDKSAGGYVEPENITAITGQLNLGITSSEDKKLGEKREVLAVMPHPEYLTSRGHDIALMVMNESSTSLHRVKRKSIRLPTVSDGAWIEKPYLALIAQGWGKVSEQGVTSHNLLEVRVPLVDRKTCKRQYEIFGSILPEEQICAGFISGGFDSCGGDSGGPLLYRQAKDSPALVAGNLSRDEVLVGVVSWGIGCARQDLFGVYTSVSRHREWLNSKAYECLREKPSIEKCN
jgi:secreted trypsin-like serine protease